MSAIHGQVSSSLSRLRTAGIEVPDLESVNDSSASGRHGPASTERAWWFSLVGSHRSGTTPLAVVTHAVEIPCEEPDPVLSRSAMLWAATMAGAEDLYLGWQREEMQQYTEGQDWLQAAEDRVAEARLLPGPEQTDWFHDELQRACAPVTADGR
ncbi:hypothetical protein [Streptomyces litchfieldiae]|uniref:Uncharacterized protein n=1 Tax=Streptomyces litchfieldiae TaxID=3075543 RepID=A0ABU2MUK4_9ACTN|nr:hypothetical protein [Streptomyces sp. DSM 44938]MDT0345087.1 hypothetical protein [Streptomyces sp. DSM 44938]